MPSTSSKQYRFFKLVYLVKTGRLKLPTTSRVYKTAQQMTLKQIQDYLHLKK